LIPDQNLNKTKFLEQLHFNPTSFILVLLGLLTSQGIAKPTSLDVSQARHNFQVIYAET
jgi:hypothetical protein